MVDTAKKARSGIRSSQPGAAADKLAALWREENNAALNAHAPFIEEHGTLAERLEASRKPRESLRAEQARQWLKENEQAFREYNDDIKKLGVWSDGRRSH